jgi:hypothetical protein
MPAFFSGCASLLIGALKTPGLKGAFYRNRTIVQSGMYMYLMREDAKCTRILGGKVES